MSSILDLDYLHPTHPSHRRFREAGVRHLSVVPAYVEPRRPAVKLTRRGRLTMFLSTVLTLIVLAVVLGSTTVATNEPGTPVPATMVTIEPGQTLWDIAAQANPNGNGQQTVADIMRLNSIGSGDGLQAGDTIAVPLYK